MDLTVLALAKRYMDKKVAELVSAGWTKEIVKELPTVGNDKTIYMVEKVDNAGNTYYDEYMYTNGKFDGIGTTRVDLSNYARLDSFNPYNFFVDDDGTINIISYNPENNVIDGFVRGLDFNTLKMDFTMLSTDVINNYQTKEDPKLKTKSKEVVQAINELKTDFSNLEEKINNTNFEPSYGHVIIADKNTSNTYKLYVEDGNLKLELNEGGEE